MLQRSLFFIFIIFSLGANAQSKKAIKTFHKAKEALKENKLEATLMFLDKAIEIDPTYAEAYSMRGDVNFSIEKKDLAAKAYKMADSLGAKYFVKYKLGVSLMDIMAFAEAEKAFLDYLASAENIREESKIKVQRYINNCAFAKEAILNPVPFDVKDLGPLVNTKDYQYHPSISIDGKTLIYTQRDPAKNPSEDFYYTNLENGEWTSGQKIYGPINTTLNEGVQTVTADGNTMYFTICHRQDGKGSCDIYKSVKMENGMWSKGENLGDSINTGQWETQPSVSSDGMTLYFVRAKRSNAGQSAIYEAHKNANGLWTKATRMSKSINTDYREASPVIHFDNQTLYFASDGHPGMGKKDIFVVRKDQDGNWSSPQNLGYPINTPSEEFGLVVSSDGKKAFFASDRMSEEEKDLNLYMFELPENVRAIPVAWIKGKVTDKNTKQSLQAHLNIVNLTTGKTLLQTETDDKGNYFAVLPANGDYAVNIAKENYLFSSKNFELKKQSKNDAMVVNVALDPIKIGASMVLNNIFFDTDSYVLRPESTSELQKLHAFLLQNPGLKIRIDGHTDNAGNVQHNLALSKNRAKAVYNYLVEHNVDKNRLQIKGFGASKPLADNETEEGKSMNRRTEITII